MLVSGPWKIPHTNLPEGARPGQSDDSILILNETPTHESDILAWTNRLQTIRRIPYSPASEILISIL